MNDYIESPFIRMMHQRIQQQERHDRLVDALVFFVVTSVIGWSLAAALYFFVL